MDWINLQGRISLLSGSCLDCSKNTHAQQYAKPSHTWKSNPPTSEGAGCWYEPEGGHLSCVWKVISLTLNTEQEAVIRPLLPETVTAQTIKSTLEQLMNCSMTATLCPQRCGCGVMQAAEQQLQGYVCIHTWGVWQCSQPKIPFL